MRIERPDLSKVSGGDNQPKLQDLQTLTQISHQIDSLQLTKSIAQSAQSSGLGSSAPPPSPDPVVNSYQQYIQDLINFLENEEHIPAKALQFIKDELSGIDPNSPEAATKLTQIIHQLFVVGLQVDPNFVQKVTGADAQKAGQTAKDQTQALQNEIAALIKAMGPEGKAFQDMIEIQAFLASYPGNMNEGFAFKAFGDAIIDLATHANDAPPWGSAVQSVFSALSSIHNGVSLSDLVATLYFLEMYSSCDSNDTFAQAAQKVAGPLQNAIKSMENADSPFCEEMVNKLMWWSNPQNLTAGNLQAFVDTKAFGNNQLGGALRSNWTTILENQCDFPTATVTAALQQINQVVSSVESPQYPELARQLAEAEQAEKSFQELTKGDWKTAFPDGSYIQGPLAPDSDDQALQTLLQALIAVMMEHASDPQVQTLLNMLLQVGSGPPYPQTVVASINEITESFCTLYPLSAQDKALLQKAFGQIDSLIQNMQNEQKAGQTSEKSLQDLLNSLQGFPNCPDSNYEKSALDFWQLLQAYEQMPSGPLKDRIGALFTEFDHLPGKMGEVFGSYLNAALSAQGMSKEQIAGLMLGFLNHHNDLLNSPFLSSMLGAGAIPEPLSTARQSMVDLYQNNPDLVTYILNTVQQTASIFQTQLNDLTQLIQQQQDLENGLKSGFPK